MTSIVTHRTGNEWCVAVNDVWVPGIYDAEETAKRATEWSDAELDTGLGHIWRFDGDDRPATMADLDKLPAPK